MNYSSRRQKSQHQTITLLKQALIDLILENGTIDNITVSEIAGKADLNRGTFYTHFKDKNELLEALFIDAIVGNKQALTEPYKQVRRVALDGVVPSTKLIFDHIEKNKKLFKALDLINEMPNLYERLESMYRQLFTEDIYIERANGNSDTDYEMMVSYESNSTLGVIKYWVRGNFKYSADYMCEQLTTFYAYPVTALVFKHRV
ncbi:TetR/AcrR family transcriptional regulator [Paenibacillus sp. NPDC058071]|uniref:TetR/AcrR family transcriptional regulator n=1 Tax=Paenibacillus sp. NPDC058071 TaxID=3346326 RepID=UPI0036DC9EEA